MTTVTARPATRTRTGTPWRYWNLVAVTGIGAYSTGVAWQAQYVSYPLYRAVAPEGFLAYHEQYGQSIPWVVILPGFVTFLATAAFFWTRPPEVSRAVGALVSTTGVAALASTVLWAIPRHDELDRNGQSSSTIDSLLQANAVRTAALTLGTLTLGWCIGRLLARRR